MSVCENRLAPCPACNRHVMTKETACPFCAAPLPGCGVAIESGPLPRGRLRRAALLAAGAGATLLSACTSAVVEYGTAILMDSGMSDGAGATDGGGAGGAAGESGALGAGGAGGHASNGTGGASPSGAGGNGPNVDGGVIAIYGAAPIDRR